MGWKIGQAGRETGVEIVHTGIIYAVYVGIGQPRMSPRSHARSAMMPMPGLQIQGGRADDGDDTTPDSNTGSGLALEESKPELKRPPMYKVLLLNDDYTPMEFVVHVLEMFFGMNREKATQVMLAVHTAGSAVCGIFPLDLAETKSEQVNQYARENDHPLMSAIEMTD